MRKRLSRAFCAVSAATVMTVGVGLSASTARASTHVTKGTGACGFSCINLFSDTLGSGVTQNAFVPGDTGAGGKVGQKINLHFAESNRPNGDFIADLSGFVWQFCGFFVNAFFSPTSYVCRHDPFFDVFEVSWARWGSQSDLCIGVAVPGVSNENVTLRPCGLTDTTLWIADRAHATRGQDCRDKVPNMDLPVGPDDPNENFCPWINGGDTNFSQPLVLTLDTGTSFPRDQLRISHELLHGGETSTEQLWACYDGPVA